jgi:ABC-type branched-subunit amino acid transport system permease subunit
VSIGAGGTRILNPTKSSGARRSRVDDVHCSTPLALVAGMLLGGLCGAILGLLIVRRRGVKQFVHSPTRI